MSRARPTLALAVSALAVALLVGPSQAADTSRARTTTIGVQNGPAEFSFLLSRTRVRSGPALIQYQNTGEDPHDLKLKRIGARRKRTTGRVMPGEIGSLSVRKLRAASVYRLWCSLDGHVAAGMSALITVKPKRR